MYYLYRILCSVPDSIQCIQYIKEMQYFWDTYLSIIIAQIQIMGKKVTDEGKPARVFWHDQFLQEIMLKKR